ncbi:D-alanyl-D-alanine carboxypeptidase [Herbihabitans rhizosphaerae]|uniref:D-alanyl-D-alanine carboxypeptidase n=1 Tax=Herbihabitans rhizosphaerae TaxID=1872711 RepID=A0A4Q7KM89_9PSEU|nr:serine hydrolase domain-containing protein [Herbihabitans rhizosphaerae]RZS37788.1 D-alanyl-D-alanine carboxypeptidase [Herbihabitans rhizosphaerae]
MRKLLVPVAVLVAAILPVPLATAEPAPPDLDAALRQVTADGYPAAAAYLRHGDQVKQAADGVADRETGRRAHAEDKFRIASNTKAFTSTVVLQLVDEGLLALDEPARRWLPDELPFDVTVRQLLNHTSGVYDPTDEPSFWEPYLGEHGNRGYVYRPRDIVARAVAHGLNPGHGTKHDYSNTNYLIAGMLIEKVTGRPAHVEISDRIIGRLGLRDTEMPRLDPFLHGRHLHGYGMDGNDLTTFSPSYDWTAGAIVSTARDLATFHRALFAGKLLSPAAQRELLTTAPTPMGGYGLGVEQMTAPCPGGPRLWGAFGAGPGYQSMSFTTLDGSKQLVAVGTIFDIGREVAHEPPAPEGPGMFGLIKAAFCP